MNSRNLRFLGTAAVAALVLALALVQQARSQINAAPSLLPIGVSASGNTSTAWFHEPHSRLVVACQTTGQGTSLSGVQCVSSKLP
jgi:uncharacterized membrane protein